MANCVSKETNIANCFAVSTALYKPTCHETCKSASLFGLPKSNYVMMTHRTNSLLENAFWGGFLGNISYTVTTQWNESESFYSYSNVGNGGASYCVGMNLGSWHGRSVYISSNIGVRTSTQLTSWFTYGSQLSVLDGITLSAGIISGNRAHEISVNAGWGGMLGAYAVATAIAAIPVPGARAFAGAAACVILLVDIFN